MEENTLYLLPKPSCNQEASFPWKVPNPLGKHRIFQSYVNTSKLLPMCNDAILHQPQAPKTYIVFQNGPTASETFLLIILDVRAGWVVDQICRVVIEIKPICEGRLIPIILWMYINI